jgi:hypothetical protein
MKRLLTSLLALAGVALAGFAVVVGAHFGAARVKQRGIFLSESSPVRKEVFEALAARVFVVADGITAARALGRSPEELHRSLPSPNWSYEPRNDGFMVRWKLSYDDDMRYESWSDTVFGTNDFAGATKRNL